MRLLENAGRNNPGICIDDPCITQLTSRGSALIEAMLKQWPVGLFRMCAPQVCILFSKTRISENCDFLLQVRLTGRYLSLDHQNQSAVLNKVAIEV